MTTYAAYYGGGDSGTVPAASDVRLGVAVGDATGTLAVPSAANVLAGVAVDDTVGEALLTESSATTISLFTGEAKSISRTVYDADGNAVTLTNLSLELVVEALSGTDVAVIANADIARSGSTFTFTVPSAVVASQRTLNWALRMTNTGSVLMHGKMPVTKAAKAD